MISNKIAERDYMYSTFHQSNGIYSTIELQYDKHVSSHIAAV